ncbi:hypothetical protein GCM10009628_27760 [Paeniglutamicibacter kerguelensis]
MEVYKHGGSVSAPERTAETTLEAHSAVAKVLRPFSTGALQVRMLGNAARVWTPWPAPSHLGANF